MSELKTDKISPRTASGTITLGDSGDTFTVPSGVTLTNNGTATGFSEPAYAANASASTGAVNVDASDNLQFDSGFGSTATAYGCRAWCFWHQNGTQSIYGSANISSITDLGVGITQLNFANAMPDANYSAPVTTNAGSYSNSGNKTTTSFRVTTLNNALGAYDAIVADTIVLR